jgi:transcriptional regulator with XRE-family HTH domain
MITIGKKIRLLRKQNSWSQDDMSKKLDISIPAFSKIETGVTDINFSRLEQIAGLFKMTVVQLLLYGEESTATASADLALLNTRLINREEEVIYLQNKLIVLYEEINQTAKK